MKPLSLALAATFLAFLTGFSGGDVLAFMPLMLAIVSQFLFALSRDLDDVSG